MTAHIPVQIDPARVEQAIFRMAEFGAHGATGVSRTVYSPAWIEATQALADWLETAGLQVTHDAVGNVWGRLEGTDGGTAIVTGSHIDSQTPGGRYDGILGIIAGYIAVSSLKEQFGAPKRPIEVLAFCEEESSRFPNAGFWGSQGITGFLTPERAEAVRGYADESIADAMRAIGLDPALVATAKRDDIGIFIELHIEQGPILEQVDVPVAVVRAITGIRHSTVTLTGTSNHAGAFPMDLRRDPMAAAAEIISGVIDTAHRMGRPAVTTVGRMMVEPNFPAIIPERVQFTIDSRHPDPEARSELYAKQEDLIAEVTSRRSIDYTLTHAGEHAPVRCDPEIVRVLEDAARDRGIPSITMDSGAAHDTQQMALIADVAMIFVRSKDGRSHTPAEFSSIEDIVAGIELLAEGLYQLAYR